MLRALRPTLCTLLASAFAGCASDPDSTVAAPDREFTVESGTELESRGSLMLKLNYLQEQWLGVKNKTPRTAKIEQAQATIESTLRDHSERHRSALLEVLRAGTMPGQRSSAAICLGFATERREEVLETLIGVLERDTNNSVRSDVLVGLGTLAHPRTPLGPVMDVIEHGKIDASEPYSFSMRTRAAYCLLKTTAAGAGDPSIGDRILVRLGDREEDVAVSSQLARAAIGREVRTPATPAALLAMLDHPAPRAVAAAITSLGDLGDRTCGLQLAEKLADSDPTVRIAAYSALRQIYDRDLGAEAEAWRRNLSEAPANRGGS